jgi:hypothetical protein
MCICKVNHRVHPSDSIKRVLAHDQAVINDPRVAIKVLDSLPASPVSSPSHPAFADMRAAVRHIA